MSCMVTTQEYAGLTENGLVKCQYANVSECSFIHNRLYEKAFSNFILGTLLSYIIFICTNEAL